ncbi:MAG TPA: hypothetical protein VGA87_00345, partial [Pyrinomonadaceae bacterium]
MRHFIQQATRMRLIFLTALLCLAASVAPAQEVAPRAAPGASSSSPRSAQEKLAATPTLYRINFTLDFDARTFTATERVRWVNRDTRPASAVYFHLYANLRSPSPATGGGGGGDAPRPAPAAGDKETAAATTDEPRIEIKSVRHAATQSPLVYALDEQATLLRVNLREPVAAGAATDIEIAFAGVVPEIDPDETSLPSHVIQQLGAALRDTRETRRARDINFRARGVMLLGSAYPVLAVRNGDEWQREVRATVGDPAHTEVADYEVTIDAPADVALFTSGEAHRADASSAVNDGSDVSNGSVSNNSSGVRGANVAKNGARAFAGENLRNFTILAGRGLASSERVVGGVRVRSIWTTEHEKIGRRVLDVAVEAVRVFTARYGAPPASSVSVAEA